MFASDWATWAQPPPAQLKSQVAPGPHSWRQAPPAQVAWQLEPGRHEIEQAPSGQRTTQASPAAQVTRPVGSARMCGEGGGSGIGVSGLESAGPPQAVRISRRGRTLRGGQLMEGWLRYMRVWITSLTRATT